MKDRLWFFGSYREWGNERQAAGKFYNKTQGTLFYTPDLEPAGVRPRVDGVQGHAGDVAGVGEKQVQLLRRSPARLPLPGECGEWHRSTRRKRFSATSSSPAGLYQATWNAPVTNRLLLEAGAAWRARQLADVPAARSQRKPDDISILEQSTGMRYNAVTDLQRRTGRSALLSARLRVLRHRVACLQGWVPARGAACRTSAGKSHEQRATTRSTIGVPVSLTQ